jgi:DNA repair photolyase
MLKKGETKIRNFIALNKYRQAISLDGYPPNLMKNYNGVNKMKVNLVDAKSIITKSKIPSVDYVINPYVGCQHRCHYCYAVFMTRFTGHTGEKWGDFLDVKDYDWSKIKPEKYDGKILLLSSVTDPYLPLEQKYGKTRKILESLLGTEGEIWILTKSKLLTRDIDLFKQFKNIQVGVSLNTLDTDFARALEPGASKPLDRLAALKKVHEAGVPTFVFISPIFPHITDFQAIITHAKSFTDTFRFENLNYRPHNITPILDLIRSQYPDLIDFYQNMRKDRSYWDSLEPEIRDYCQQMGLNFKIEFHHGGFSKKSKKTKATKKSKKQKKL